MSRWLRGEEAGMRLDIGDGFAIRSFEKGDARAIVKYANNRNVWLGVRDAFPYPYTIKNAREWLRYAMGQKPECNFAIASPDEVVGGIGVGLFKGERRISGEVGYWLGEPFWGRGITTRAVTAFTEYVFETFGLARAYAEVYASNPASMRVLEKAGYVREAHFHNAIIKDDKVLDQYVYARLNVRQPHRETQEP
jgi:ribosomal-protein-alanine N-acetyltransferase